MQRSLSLRGRSARSHSTGRGPPSTSETKRPRRTRRTASCPPFCIHAVTMIRVPCIRKGDGSTRAIAPCVEVAPPAEVVARCDIGHGLTWAACTSWESAGVAWVGTSEPRAGATTTTHRRIAMHDYPTNYPPTRCSTRVTAAGIGIPCRPKARVWPWAPPVLRRDRARRRRGLRPSPTAAESPWPAASVCRGHMAFTRSDSARDGSMPSAERRLGDVVRHPPGHQRHQQGRDRHQRSMTDNEHRGRQGPRRGTWHRHRLVGHQGRLLLHARHLRSSGGPRTAACLQYRSSVVCERPYWASAPKPPFGGVSDQDPSPHGHEAPSLAGRFCPTVSRLAQLWGHPCAFVLLPQPPRFSSPPGRIRLWRPADHPDTVVYVQKSGTEPAENGVFAVAP